MFEFLFKGEYAFGLCFEGEEQGVHEFATVEIDRVTVGFEQFESPGELVDVDSFVEGEVELGGVQLGEGVDGFRVTVGQSALEKE